MHCTCACVCVRACVHACVHIRLLVCEVSAMHGGGVKLHSTVIAQVTTEEKEEEIDEEVGVPYPNLQESMYYFEQGGVSVCVYMCVCTYVCMYT